jgi:hypothetical protein
MKSFFGRYNEVLLENFYNWTRRKDNTIKFYKNVDERINFLIENLKTEMLKLDINNDSW